MEFFLDKLAKTLYNGYGSELHRHCIVFPNRRAGLFFLRYLSGYLDRPLWKPGVITINELFLNHSTLQPAGKEFLLLELYKVYKKLKKSAESFDNFFYWGDILLNDFDDIDKYIIDAGRLFRDIKDIKDIDREFETLDERQKEIVRSFWVNFDRETPSDEKEGFISLWSVLSEVYSEFRSNLQKRNLAYEGMIFRQIAEDDSEIFSAKQKWDRIHFAGFNALNECERRVMLRLSKNNLACFYWDYDESYLNMQGYNSAGYFLRNNISLFGNDMPEDWSYNTLISGTRNKPLRKLIDTSSDIAQVKLIPQIISDFDDINPHNAHETAIVLTDENLLIPVLSTIPEHAGDVNITMGLPLSQTRVYSLVRKLMDLQMNSKYCEGKSCFQNSDVDALLTDSLIADLICRRSQSILDEIRNANLTLIP